MSAVNEKIIEFAKTNLNQKIDQGECWDLAFRALENAGAKTPTGSGASLYKWSSQKVSMSEAQVGDIIQYKNFKIKIETEDKAGNITWNVLTIGMPRHTAILKSKKSNGVVEVYEQNMDNKKSVKINSYHLEKTTYTDSAGTKIKVTIQGGKFIIYRPKENAKKTTSTDSKSSEMPTHVAIQFQQDHKTSRKNHYTKSLFLIKPKAYV